MVEKSPARSTADILRKIEQLELAISLYRDSQAQFVELAKDTVKSSSNTERTYMKVIGLFVGACIAVFGGLTAFQRWEFTSTSHRIEERLNSADLAQKKFFEEATSKNEKFLFELKQRADDILKQNKLGRAFVQPIDGGSSMTFAVYVNDTELQALGSYHMTTEGPEVMARVSGIIFRFAGDEFLDIFGVAKGVPDPRFRRVLQEESDSRFEEKTASSVISSRYRSTNTLSVTTQYATCEDALKAAQKLINIRSPATVMMRPILEQYDGDGGFSDFPITFVKVFNDAECISKTSGGSGDQSVEGQK